MVTDQDILRQVPRLLTDLSGVEPEAVGRPEDDAADLVLRLGGRILVVEAKRNASAGVLVEAAKHASSVAARFGADAVAVLAVPFMGDVGRRICQEAGVGYLDLSGNAHIKAPPLLIRVEGRPNQFVRRGRPSSVFAPKSSRVARLLLLDPKRWWKQGELVSVGALGAGYVSRLCKRLEEDQLVERGPDRAVRARDPKLLLEAWRSRYDFQSHDITRGHVSARTGEELTELVVRALGSHHVSHALTGLAAAWKLAPFAGYRLTTVYVEENPDERLLESLKWKAGDRGANLWLVRPNDEGVFQGAAVVQGARCVSPVQAYLDLQGLPERADEAAEHLRKELLPWT